jgi:hypothetical protein
VSIAEVGFRANVMQFVVKRELGTIVKGDRLTPGSREWTKHFRDGLGDRLSIFACWPADKQQPGVPLVKHKNPLSIRAEEHQVDLPMAGRSATLYRLGTFTDGATESN